MVTKDGLLKSMQDAAYLYEQTGFLEYVRIYLEAEEHLKGLGLDPISMNLPKLNLMRQHEKGYQS